MKKMRNHGYYKSFSFTIEAIIRDDTGRNDSFEVVWENDTPDNAEEAEEEVINGFLQQQQQQQQQQERKED